MVNWGNRQKYGLVVNYIPPMGGLDMNLDLIVFGVYLLIVALPPNWQPSPDTNHSTSGA
jgi:hypothetical protein